MTFLLYGSYLLALGGFGVGIIFGEYFTPLHTNTYGVFVQWMG
jgi:hypothetical protein